MKDNDSKRICSNKKIAIYIRVASREHDSVQVQKEATTKFVNKMFDTTNISYYIDNGFSGLNFNRPALKNMLKDIERHKIDIVVVKELSRIGRGSLNEMDDIILFIKEHDVGIIDIQEQRIETIGEMINNKLKSEIKNVKTKKVKESKSARGKELL